MGNSGSEKREGLDDVVGKNNELSSSPEILPKIQRVLKKTSYNIDEIGALIKVDPSLATQVVKLSNSAFMGRGIPCSNVEDAINCLGVQEVYRVVSIVVANKMFGKALPLYHLEPGRLWEQSIHSAVHMETIFETLNRDHNTAYTIGLLRMVGKVIINNHFEKTEFDFPEDQFNWQQLTRLEKKTLGFDHAEVGATLLERWNFPEEMCIPTRFQYDPLLTSESEQTTACLFLSIWMMDQAKAMPDPNLWKIDFDPQIMERVGLKFDDLIDIRERIIDRLAEIEMLLDIL